MTTQMKQFFEAIAEAGGTRFSESEIEAALTQAKHDTQIDSDNPLRRHLGEPAGCDVLARLVKS